MAATNFTPIILYHTTTASAAPTAGNLNNGELAINITDGKLFYKDNGGTVQVIATKGTGTIGGSNTQVQYNSSGALAGSANFTFNGTTATINTLNLTNALGTAYGGTALTTYTQGDLVYASAANTLAKLGIGANTYILTSTGSVPQWSAPSAVTVATANNLAGGAAGSVPYQSGASTTTFLSIGTSGQILSSTGSAPQWSSPAALTKTDDTNVTLTLGGSASTALVNAASLTLGWTGQLSIARGGTNATATPTAGAVAYGTGTAYAFTAAGTSGQVLTSNGAGVPTWASLSSIGVTTFSAGTTGFTPSTATSGAITLAGTLATTNGGTGLTSFTANGVLYASSTSALTSGSALTFDGTTFATTGRTSAANGAWVASGAVMGWGAAGTFSNYIVGDTTSNYLLFQVNSAEGMRLTSTGLGIGTSSPLTILHAVGNLTLGAQNSTTQRIVATPDASVINTGTAALVIKAGQANANTGGGDAGGLTLSGGDSNRTGASNGTAGATLVRGGDVLDGGVGNTEGAGGAGSLTLRGGDNAVGGNSSSSAGNLTIRGGNLSLKAASNGSPGSVTIATGSLTTNGQGWGGSAPFIAFQTGTTSVTERARITSGGQLLIGTTSASGGRLEVQGASTSSYSPNVYQGSNANSVRLKSGGSPTTSDTVGISMGVGGNAEAYIGAVQNTSGYANIVFQGFNGAYTEYARITSDGNFGIGTSSPLERLDVVSAVQSRIRVRSSTANEAVLLLQNSNTGTTSGDGLYVGITGAMDAYLWNYENNPVIFGTNNTERARITSGGNLLIGTTSDQNRRVQINGQLALIDSALNSIADIDIQTNGEFRIRPYNASGSVIIFGTSPSGGGVNERVRIDSGGNFYVGTTTSYGRATIEAGANANGLFVINDTYDYQTLSLWNKAGANDNLFARFFTESSVTLRGSITYNRGAGLTAYNTTSDYRAKDISGSVTDSGALIDSVPVYMGKMKGATQERPMFIAHEVPAYARTGEKDAVDADGNPVYQQMDASALIPVMWAEIQSLRQRLAAAGF